MNFSSFNFIFYFFPIFIFFYFLTPSRLRKYITITGSVLFYLWATPPGAIILICSIVFDYFLALKINISSRKFRTALFIIGVIFNLAILAYFKYSVFIVNSLKPFVPMQTELLLHGCTIIHVIGVSFFVFTKIAFLFDLYQNEITPMPSFMSYCTYVFLFPKLLQGPIARYGELQTAIENPITTLDNTHSGLQYFIIGLAKKVLIADSLGSFADTIFALKIINLSTEYAWLGMFAYTFQIYFDFSGYTDMAIGIGKIMGYNIPDNFNRPYLASSFTEFWKRWHITLTSWFRRYLYIPLGGNRISSIRTYINLWIVFLLSGLWHGANWTFVVWGIYHGTFLIIERYFWNKISHRFGTAVNVSITFIMVAIGWVFFRSDTIGSALQFIVVLFNPARIGDSDLPFAYIINNRHILILIIAAALSFIPESAGQYFRNRFVVKINTRLINYLSMLGFILLFIISITALSNSNFRSFIYMRF